MKTRNRIVGAGIALLSAGWLFPMWLGVSTCLSFWSLQAGPMRLGRETGRYTEFIVLSH